MPKVLLSRLAAKLSRWTDEFQSRVWHATSFKAAFEGIPIAIDFNCHGRLEEIERGLEAALQLIEEYHPVRFGQIARDVDQIWVRPLIHRAEYRYGPRACVLEPRFVAEFRPEVIAASIVHEATHARISNRGIIADDEFQRDREERICRRAELFFGRRVPDGEIVITRAEQSMNLELGGLTPGVPGEVRYLTQIAELEAQNLPKWMERFLKRVLRKRWGYTGDRDGLG